MSQRFLRCAHCGLPHPIEDAACPVTGRPLAGPGAPRSARPPDSDPRNPPSAGMIAASVHPTARGGMSASSPPPPGSAGRIPVSANPSSRGRVAAAQPTPFDATPMGNPSVVGQTLGGKYKVLRVLGEGGMGSVYECEHVTLHRRVAIKVLNPTQARKNASVQRFHNEAQVAGAIGHPNICEIYDIGETDDGSPFLVMELLHGRTLADRIASEGALPFDDVVEIISQVLSGLVAAHDKGIIHRDIKPENVFLSTRPGIPPLAKLLDFGISKVAGADDLHLTRTGMVMGTPFYMSPEQARGDRNLDHRVDIYATGVMMYECLTGRRPYTAANYNALLVQILTTSPRPPHEIRPAVPLPFEEVVRTAMHRERDKRFRTAAEMQRALVALRDPVGAAQRRVGSVPPEPVPLVTPKRDPAKPRERELDSISVDLDKPALLGEAESDSGSIEIPIVTDDVKSVSDAPKSQPLYRPPRQSTPSKASPPVARPPRPEPRPPLTRPPATQRGVQPTESKASKSLPPPLPSTRKPRMVTPTPTPVDPRLLGLDAPWLQRGLDDDEPDDDPTEVGALPHAHDPRDATEVGPLLGLKRATDTPIDPDATERMEPRFAQPPRPDRRSARAAQSPRAADPRREPPEDEAPTTLFDRRALGPSGAPPRHTTERAPAPREEPKQDTSIPRAPRRT